MAYPEFKAYDVCQIKNGKGGEWLDYATIKNEDDARIAASLVRAGQGKFRIVGESKIKVKLA